MSRVALVTGASRGIGRAVAIRLAQDHAAVTVVARSADGLESACEAIRARGAQAFAIPLDLKQPQESAEAVARTVSRFGRLDSVATIAGDVAQIDLFQLDDEGWADSLALKFHSMRRLMLAAWPHLKASRGAAVITSGTSAITPKAAFGAVGAINALILACAKAFAERGKADGVRVNTILPGPVLTDRRRTMILHFAQTAGISPGEAETAFERQSGIIRYGQPEDVAEAYAWSLSPSASWITGTALRVDGGEISSV